MLSFLTTLWEKLQLILTLAPALEKFVVLLEKGVSVLAPYAFFSTLFSPLGFSEQDIMAMIGLAVVLCGILIIVIIVCIICGAVRRKKERGNATRRQELLRKRKEALTHGQRIGEDDYGYSPYNPIVMSPGVMLPQYGLYGKEIEAYLSALRTSDGKPLTFRKTGVAKLSKLYGQKDVRVERYRMYCYVDGKRVRYCTLYICPEGFRLENPPLPKGLKRVGQQGTTAGPGSAQEAETRTYYALLGVAKDADKETISAAYKQLARKYHPDVSSEPDAAEIMKQINIARDVLMDPARRADYDRKIGVRR